MSAISPRTSPTALFAAIEHLKARVAQLESKPLPVNAKQTTVAWEAPTAKTYWINLRADRAYSIKRVSAKTVAGTCTLQLVTDSGNLGSAIPCSTTLATTLVSLSLPAGAFLKATISSVVGVDDLCLTLDYE